MAATKAAENHGDDTWPDTYDEGYIHQFQPGPTHKIQHQQQKHHIYRYPPMEHRWNDQEQHFNQHKNSHKLCNAKSHPILGLTESQWKLRQHDQNFLMMWKPLQKKTSIRRNELNQNSRPPRLILRVLCGKLNYLSVVVWERSISSTRIG